MYRIAGRRSRLGRAVHAPRARPAPLALGTRAALALLLGLAGTVAARADAPAAAAALPDPGYCPDHPGYPVDRMAERFQLLFTPAGEQTLELSLAFAREKLAEALAMVHAGEAGYAWIAVGLYKDYLARSAKAVAALEGAAAAAARSRYARALLGHIQAVAADRRPAPREVRAFALEPLVGAAMRHYEAQHLQMAPAQARALAAAEAEIRALLPTLWGAPAAPPHPARRRARPPREARPAR